MNKKTILAALPAVGITLVTLVVINNTKALEKVKDTINGKTGWF